jgi:ribulose-5-phosphate 4-epimerase/fuculose-1-phosphate aldolase
MMNAPMSLQSRPVSASDFSEAEWQVRVDLAAAYRLLHHFRMTDLIYNHISARVPGHEDRFLINPYGMVYEEITASCLVEVDSSGNILRDDTGLGINPGGFTIHSAVHRVRPDVACVMHTHTAATLAVATMKRGLLPLTQQAMRFTNRIAYHDYEGVYFHDAERYRLQASLGNRMVMLLRNHGSLVCGRTISEAFDTMYYLERACQAQVALLSLGEPLVEPPIEVGEQVASVFDSPSRAAPAKIWPAMLRLLDRWDPSYRS